MSHLATRNEHLLHQDGHLCYAAPYIDLYEWTHGHPGPLGQFLHYYASYAGYGDINPPPAPQVPHGWATPEEAYMHGNLDNLLGSAIMQSYDPKDPYIPYGWGPYGYYFRNTYKNATTGQYRPYWRWGYYTMNVDWNVVAALPVGATPTYLRYVLKTNYSGSMAESAQAPNNGWRLPDTYPGTWNSGPSTMEEVFTEETSASTGSIEFVDRARMTLAILPQQAFMDSVPTTPTGVPYYHSGSLSDILNSYVGAFTWISEIKLYYTME